jgi:hypothetical protein
MANLEENAALSWVLRFSFGNVISTGTLRHYRDDEGFRAFTQRIARFRERWNIDGKFYPSDVKEIVDSVLGELSALSHRTKLTMGDLQAIEQSVLAASGRMEQCELSGLMPSMDDPDGAAEEWAEDYIRIRIAEKDAKQKGEKLTEIPGRVAERQRVRDARKKPNGNTAKRLRKALDIVIKKGHDDLILDSDRNNIL